MSARDVIARILTRPSVYQGALPAMALRQADNILSAIHAAGYVVVPMEPTKAMVLAAAGRKHEDDEETLFYGAIYRAMIAAAIRARKEDGA